MIQARLPAWLFEGFQSWHETKVFLERLTSVSHDALHIVAGMLVWLLLALVLRRPITSWIPLIGTAVVIVINELVDLWVEIWPERAMQAGEAGKDILTTILVPMLFFVALRTMPRLIEKQDRKR